MYSITKNGKCAKHLCVIDEKTKSVSTTENGLVFDFTDLEGWSFKTGYNCIFKTGSSCTFKAGFGCRFDTGSYCTFNTGSNCTFDTGSYCTFDTIDDCTFKVGKQCVLVRRDVYEVIELPVDKVIKLNAFEVQGYTFVDQKKTITIELDEKQIESLRQQGFDIK